MNLSRLGDYLDQMQMAASDARRFVDGMSKEDSPCRMRGRIPSKTVGDGAIPL